MSSTADMLVAPVPDPGVTRCCCRWRTALARPRARARRSAAAAGSGSGRLLVSGLYRPAPRGRTRNRQLPPREDAGRHSPAFASILSCPTVTACRRSSSRSTCSYGADRPPALPREICKTVALIMDGGTRRPIFTAYGGAKRWSGSGSWRWAPSCRSCCCPASSGQWSPGTGERVSRAAHARPGPRGHRGDGDRGGDAPVLQPAAGTPRIYNLVDFLGAAEPANPFCRPSGRRTSS